MSLDTGIDVVTIGVAGLVGARDNEILARAYAEGRVVLTQDADFGTLAVARGEPYTGIVFLRPGNLPVHEIVATVATAWAHEKEIDVEIPFILVIERRAGGVRVRLRGPALQEK
ncbi:MAG TPA: DUF5615 family PIN-like protein [Polyangia bacterium]|nr:DUF5615 family PIN-like protein [Polyangia bacterium]